MFITVLGKSRVEAIAPRHFANKSIHVSDAHDQFSIIALITGAEQHALPSRSVSPSVPSNYGAFLMGLRASDRQHRVFSNKSQKTRMCGGGTDPRRESA